jgi:hypothetical protein
MRLSSRPLAAELKRWQLPRPDRCPSFAARVRETRCAPSDSSSPGACLCRRPGPFDSSPLGACRATGADALATPRGDRKQLIPAGRSALCNTLTTNSALATFRRTCVCSPQKAVASPARVQNSGSTVSRPPQLFGLCDEGIATPLWLTRGVHHQHRIELAPGSECVQTLGRARYKAATRSEL